MTRGGVRSGQCGRRDAGGGGEGISSCMGRRPVAGCFGVGGGSMRTQLRLRCHVGAGVVAGFRSDGGGNGGEGGGDVGLQRSG